MASLDPAALRIAFNPYGWPGPHRARGLQNVPRPVPAVGRLDRHRRPPTGPAHLRTNTFGSFRSAHSRPRPHTRRSGRSPTVAECRSTPTNCRLDYRAHGGPPLRRTGMSNPSLQPSGTHVERRPRSLWIHIPSAFIAADPADSERPAVWQSPAPSQFGLSIVAWAARCRPGRNALVLAKGRAVGYADAVLMRGDRLACGRRASADPSGVPVSPPWSRGGRREVLDVLPAPCPACGESSRGSPRFFDHQARRSPSATSPARSRFVLLARSHESPRSRRGGSHTSTRPGLPGRWSSRLNSPPRLSRPRRRRTIEQPLRLRSVPTKGRRCRCRNVLRSGQRPRRPRIAASRNVCIRARVHCSCPSSPSLSACDFDVQGNEALLPKEPVMTEPFVDLRERLGRRLYTEARPSGAPREAGLTQHSQMPRNAGASDRQQRGQPPTVTEPIL